MVPEDQSVERTLLFVFVQFFQVTKVALSLTPTTPTIMGSTAMGIVFKNTYLKITVLQGMQLATVIPCIYWTPHSQCSNELFQSQELF